MDTLSTLKNITFTEIMTGGMPTAIWSALFVLYMIGATIYQGRKVSKGIKRKSSSPNKLDLVYYFTDFRNYVDFAVAVLSGYVFILAAGYNIDIEANIGWLVFVAIALGAGWQLIADKLLDLLRLLLDKFTASLQKAFGI